MTKIEKLAAKLSEKFRNVLADEMKNRYGIEIETHFNFASGQIVSTRLDGQDFTPEQKQFADYFGDGFAAAMVIVRNEGA